MALSPESIAMVVRHTGDAVIYSLSDEIERERNRELGDAEYDQLRLAVEGALETIITEMKL